MKGLRTDGIRTLDDLMQRCYVREETGCWEWKLTAYQGTPRVWVSVLHRVCTGPAAVAFLTGKPTSPGRRAWRTCSNLMCVAPDHIKVGTNKQCGAWIAKSGKLKNQPKRIAACRAPRVRKGVNLTQEIADQIREAAGTIAEVAKQFGISRSNAGKIRSGVSWNLKPLPGSSVFNWSQP